MNRLSRAPLIVKYLLFVILLALFCSGASRADSSYSFNEKESPLLTTKQIKLLDAKAAKAVPECRFIYHKVPIGSINGGDIYKCTESWAMWFWTGGKEEALGRLPESKRIISLKLLDAYLGDRVMPYISSLPKYDQAKLLRKIVVFHTENLVFIQTMIERGVSVEKVLLSQIGDGGPWASCDAYMLFLNKNIALYQNDKTLYEPIFGADEEDTESPYRSYRWKDMHHLTDSAYNICPEAIVRLARANPELLNKKDSSGYYEDTPLVLFLRQAFIKNPSDIRIVNELITPININMKDSNDDTPLHSFLTNENASLEYKKKIVKIMISRGADINIKNKKGITAKYLMLEHKL
jgi:hypothetical protein